MIDYLVLDIGVGTRVEKHVDHGCASTRSLFVHHGIVERSVPSLFAQDSGRKETSVNRWSWMGRGAFLHKQYIPRDNCVFFQIEIAIFDG